MGTQIHPTAESSGVSLFPQTLSLANSFEYPNTAQGGRVLDEIHRDSYVALAVPFRDLSARVQFQEKMILRIQRHDAVEHVPDPSLIGPNYVFRVKAIECEERPSD